MLPEYPFYAPECFFNAFSMPGDVSSMPGDCIWLRFFVGLRRFFSISNEFVCANELEICCFDHCIIRVSKNLTTLIAYRRKTMRKSRVSSRSTSFEMTFRILGCQRLLFTDITACGSVFFGLRRFCSI